MTGFEGLPWGTIWEVVKAIGGIGLFAFAAAQLWILRRERTDRRRAAFGIVYADFVRLLARRADWDGADLVKMAASGMLYYEDIASPEWGLVASNLGGLSVSGLALFSHAYALLGQAADSARLLASSNGGRVGEMTGQQIADHCQKTLKEAVLTFEDALAEIPRDVQALAITNPSPKSGAGKGFRQVYLERVREDQEHTSGFWATRAGRVLSAIGRALRP